MLLFNQRNYGSRYKVTAKLRPKAFEFYDFNEGLNDLMVVRYLVIQSNCLVFDQISVTVTIIFDSEWIPYLPVYETTQCKLLLFFHSISVWILPIFVRGVQRQEPRGIQSDNFRGDESSFGVSQSITRPPIVKGNCHLSMVWMFRFVVFRWTKRLYIELSLFIIPLLCYFLVF